MASAPPVTAIDLVQFSEIVDNARTDGERGQNTGVVATANDGRPDVALKGSLMVWDADHLAWWERGRAETEAAVRANPQVAVMVRNSTRDRRTLRFYGEARLVDDPALRERVWERCHPSREGHGSGKERRRRARAYRSRPRREVRHPAPLARTA